MAEKLLDRRDVVPLGQQGRRETVAQRVAAGVLRDPGLPDRLVDRLLNRALVQVVSPSCSRLLVEAGPRGREHELPRPLAIRVGILAGQGAGQRDASEAAREITVMHGLDSLQMLLQRIVQHVRQHRPAVCSALPVSHDQLAKGEVDVLDADAKRFHLTFRGVECRRPIDLKRVQRMVRYGPRPTMYCRKCRYVLDGLDIARCPECGRPFDPTKRWTYCRRPGRWRWFNRLLLFIGTVLLMAVIGAGCYYRDHAVQTAAIEEIKSLGRRTRVRGEPLGPEWLVKWLKKRGHPVLITNVSVTMPRKAGDADLARLKNLRRLRALYLIHTKVTDDGLAQVGRETGLQHLDLGRTKVTDRGLKHLRGFHELRRLMLSRTAVTDAGLDHIVPLNSLEALNLSGTKVTDAGIVKLAALRQLEWLRLDDTNVTDACLAHARALPRLRYLNLRGTQVTEAGLAHLQGLHKLRRVLVKSGQFSKEGIAEWEEALPNVSVLARR